MKQLSMDSWYNAVVFGVPGLVDEMLAHLSQELPILCSVTFERACNLQCKHCIYQLERSSASFSHAVGMQSLVSHIVSQLPQDSRTALLHEGRIVRPWHLDVMRAAKSIRPELRLGLIDNGSYTGLLDCFNGLTLDWMDISVDGLREVHNRQRASDKAWDMAMSGFAQARSVAKEVNVPYTLTNINYGDVFATAEYLLESGLADGMDVSTMSPSRAELAPYEITAEQLATAWGGAVAASRAYPNRFFFRLYRHPDVYKLAQVVGVKKFLDVVYGEYEDEGNYLVGVEVGKISFVLDGVLVTYAPLSTWPPETFLIDADGAYRTAYSIGYTLEELRSGKSKDGQEDLTGFTVGYLTDQSDFSSLYQKCVHQWWDFRGARYFQEECEIFHKLKNQL